MDRDERCGEYLVWQFLFDCAECRKSDDAKQRSTAAKTIKTSAAAGVDSLAAENRQIDMDQTSI